MAPNAVCRPVRTTSARAVPLRALVPMNTQPVRRPSGAPGSDGPTRLATGKLSPVSVASLVKKSLASSSTASAGTMLPAFSSTTSPGTTSLAGTACSTPSRRTRAFSTSRPASCSSAPRAPRSRQKPMPTLVATMKPTSAASVSPPANSETPVAKTSSSTSGDASWRPSSRQSLSCWRRSTRLGPCSSSRRRASAPDNPDRDDFSASSSSEGGDAG